MMFSLKGKIALVTGAAQGMGLCVAKRFLDAEAEAVVMIDLNEKLVFEEASRLGPRAEAYKLDVTDEEAVQKLMEHVKEKYGRVDILSNNAGIIFPDRTFEETTSAECRKIMEVNYMGYFLMMKYAVPLMPDCSAIVNIASGAGVAAYPGYTSYAASKGAVVMLTKSAALELADRGIRVNCVAPGSVNGPMLDQPGCEGEKYMAKYQAPLGRPCEPEEVAALIHFLASDDCKFITAETVIIDGGMINCAVGRIAQRKFLEGLNV